MALPVDVIQCSVKLSGSGLRNGGAIVFNVIDPGGGLAVDGLTIRNAFSDNIFQMFPAAIVWDNLRVETNLAVLDIPGDGAGGAAHNAVSSNTSILARFLTGVPGKGMTGRMFLPGADETKVDPAGGVDATYRTAIQALVDGFLADLSAGGCDLVVLHRLAVTRTLVTAGVVENIVASQRRRLRG